METANYSAKCMRRSKKQALEHGVGVCAKRLSAWYSTSTAGGACELQIERNTEASSASDVLGNQQAEKDKV